MKSGVICMYFFFYLRFDEVSINLNRIEGIKRFDKLKLYIFIGFQGLLLSLIFLILQFGDLDIFVLKGEEC